MNDTVIYETLRNLEIYSEQSRWTRLGSLLIVESILLVAWSALFTNDPFPLKQWLLTALCATGLLFGLIWAVTGNRLSSYHKVFDEAARDLEKSFEAVSVKPYHLKDPLREQTKISLMHRLTSGRSIVAAVPLVFSMLFAFLAVVSWLDG